MSEGSGWAAVIIAVVALLGTGITTWQASRAGRQTNDVAQRERDLAAFDSIRGSLQGQIDQLRSEMADMKREVEKLTAELTVTERLLRMAMSVVRDANRRLTRCSCGQEAVPVTPELLPWSL
jgi:uncharacterized protein HemX